MLDLGESINDMLYCIYAYLNLGSLKNTGVIIQLTNQFNAYLKGVLKDFLMLVNEFGFLTDFYVLNMNDYLSFRLISLPLVRPSTKIAWTKIDVHDGTLKVEFDDKVISFNIFEAMSYPSDLHYYFSVDILDSLT